MLEMCRDLQLVEELQGLKPGFSKSSDVAAEAATYKAYL